jgi:hypothetical protein
MKNGTQQHTEHRSEGREGEERRRERPGIAE